MVITVNTTLSESNIEAINAYRRAMSERARNVLADYDKRITEGQDYINDLKSSNSAFCDHEELRHFQALVRTDIARRNELVTIFVEQFGLDVQS